ncbi:unnamed protein product [Lymnaea stagnalis]|uniref:TNFR-Cys domain-containing protein n=1 Tax=Lymnaea stagnalis TaxID=6523 RepID=A0AAV2H2H0_LYMST
MIYRNLMLVVIMLMNGHVTAEFVCQRGQYVQRDGEGTLSCALCPEATFMSHDNHQNVNCKPCSIPEPYRHERLVKSCTPFHDAVVGCDESHYREKHAYDDFDDSECVKCTSCQVLNMHEARPCDEFTDAVCCPKPGMKVVHVKDGRDHCEH